MHPKGKHPLRCIFFAWTIELGSDKEKLYLDISNARTNGINYAWQPRWLMDISRGGLEPPPTPNGMYATFVGDGLPDVPDTRTKIKKLCVTTKNAPRI